MNLFKSRYLLAVCVVGVMAGCATPQPVPVSRQQLTAANLEQIGESLLRDGCGKSVKISEKSVPNSYVEGTVDQIKTVRCDGLEGRIYLAKNAPTPDGLPMHLDISRPHPGIPQHINVGASAAGLLFVLGKPSVEEEGKAIYDIDEAGSKVTFQKSDGKISRILWDWYLE